MVNLSSENIEKKLLAFLFTPPYHVRLMEVIDCAFAFPNHQMLATLAKHYIERYKQPPTKESLIHFSSELATDADSIDKYSDALMLLDSLPSIKFQEFEFLFDKALDYAVGRQIYDVAENVKNAFEGADEIHFAGLHKQIVNQLVFTNTSTLSRGTQRGFVYKTVQERWKKYRSVEKGDTDSNIIPYGIKAVDEKLGGMGKTFLTLIYSKTAGGKTRTAINIAFNAARAGYNVVYFSFEMAFDFLASCIDSRLAWVDSEDIVFGRLDKADKGLYKKALRKQVMEKLNIWIVDIPSGARSIHIHNELELYRSLTGLQPDLVLVDYANLMEPAVSYNGRSEKYDFLFKELHEVARQQYVAMVTATQERRVTTEVDKLKKKSDETEGVENIGLSNYIAPHCETVIRIKQSKQDKLQNRIWLVIDKNRYGVAGIEIGLIALFDRTYVGDRKIPGAGLKIRKEPK